MTLSLLPAHWLRPYMLVLLLPIALVWLRLCTQQQSSSNWKNVCDAHLLPHVLLSTKHGFDKLPQGLLAITWLLAVFALAGPSWTQTTRPLYRNQQAQVLAIDLSPDMLAEDLKPKRITRLHYKLLDLLKQDKSTGQTAILAFSEDTFIVSPLTDDMNTLLTLIPDLDPAIMPVAGHNLSRAIKQAAQLLQQSGEQRGDILLITAAAATPNDIHAARGALQAGYTVSVYGFGTQNGGPIKTATGFLEDPSGKLHLAPLAIDSLTRLAAAGGGSMITVSANDRDIHALHRKKHDTYRLSSNKHQSWQDQGRWLIGLILFFTALAFRRGWYETLLASAL
jgi:Ca-activated chloride channel homolog